MAAPPHSNPFDTGRGPGGDRGGRRKFLMKTFIPFRAYIPRRKRNRFIWANSNSKRRFKWSQKSPQIRLFQRVQALNNRLNQIPGTLLCPPTKAARNVLKKPQKCFISPNFKLLNFCKPFKPWRSDYAQKRISVYKSISPRGRTTSVSFPSGSRHPAAIRKPSGIRPIPPAGTFREISAPCMRQPSRPPWRLPHPQGIRNRRRFFRILSRTS